MPDMQTGPKAKHTPGPWFIEPIDEAVTIVNVVAHNGHFTNAVTEDVAREVLVNDAMLIAAAPDMLRALKRLAAEIEDNPEGFRLEPTCNECTRGITPSRLDKGLCAWHEARAAIAKAEGR